MIVSGRVRDIYVTNAISEYQQGFKGSWSGSYVSEGVIHVRNGFGGERVIAPKRIYLTVEVGNMMVDVRVDSDFRYAVGKLTPKRTKAIYASVPEYVSLYENESRQGKKFYCLTESSFSEWLHDSGL